jgi:RHS repeat-associated protein
MKTMQYRTNTGTYYTENRTYNNRTQTIEIQGSGAPMRSMDLKYLFAAGANNGQASQMTDVISGEQVTYQYDSLKRLIQAQTVAAGWGQSFGYDGWGNLLTKTPTAGHTGTGMSLSVNPSTNHVTTGGFAYNANGNTTNLPNVTQTLAYDTENRTAGNWYDQQNHPLDRTGVWNEYGLRGERLGTYTYAQGPQTWTPVGNPVVDFFVTTSVVTTQVSRNIYFGGRLIQSNGDTVATDRLGSVRVMQGTTAPEYYPYGEEVTSSANDREKFGTYTRESATGLDYANQRYYASVYGRFTTVDKSSLHPGDPLSWNRYGYAGADPANNHDPQGADWVCQTFGGTYGSAEGACYFLPGDVSEPSGTYLPGCPNVTMIAFDPTQSLECQSFAPPDPIIPVAGPQSPAPPECFAQLSDRPVNDPKASFFNAYHSFWWIQDASGTRDIISAGPTLQTGFLNVLVPGDNNGPDNWKDPTVWSSGLSSSVCAQVGALELAAQNFPNNKIPYSFWPGPNSNSAAHYLAIAGSFYFPVPYNLYGWDAALPIPTPPHPGSGKGGWHPCPPGRICAL